MSVAAAVKARLVGVDGVLKTLPGLSGVVIDYDQPSNTPREVVYGGQVAGTTQVAAMKGGAAGRIKRTESLSLVLHIRIYMPGQSTAEAGDARAVEIGTAIEDYVAGNPTLGDVPGLKLATVELVDLEPGSPDDDGCTSNLTLQLGLTSFLS